MGTSGRCAGVTAGKRKKVFFENRHKASVAKEDSVLRGVHLCHNTGLPFVLSTNNLSPLSRRRPLRQRVGDSVVRLSLASLGWRGFDFWCFHGVLALEAERLVTKQARSCGLVLERRQAWSLRLLAVVGLDQMWSGAVTT